MLRCASLLILKLLGEFAAEGEKQVGVAGAQLGQTLKNGREERLKESNTLLVSKDWIRHRLSVARRNA